MKSSHSKGFKLKIYCAFFLLVGVLLVFGAMAFAKYECVPCKANNYCQGGFRYPCPMDRPVTKTSGAASEDECFSCIERNGDTSNPIYDVLVDDCVSCVEYDSYKPYWNNTTMECQECEPNFTYNPEDKTCCSDAGVCKLSYPVNSCDFGYIMIDTAEKLAKIGVDTNYPLDGKYCLMNDIDLAEYNSGSGWNPIGSESKPFEGTFDGNGHTIGNLYIKSSTYQCHGLFGYGGNFRNITISNANITAIECAGALAGEAYTVDNCVVKNSIININIASKNVFAGGLVGYIQGDTHWIKNSYSTGTHVTGSVSRSYRGYIGGLVGEVYRASVENCYATDGTVTTLAESSTSGYTGGLIGYQYGHIINSYATVDVSGRSHVGGLVGEMAGEQINNHANPIIQNCYATGDVVGTDSWVGGLIGIAVGDITMSDSYAVGNVTATGGSVGGLIGCAQQGNDADDDNPFTITQCYAAGNVTSDGTEVGGLIGRTWQYIYINKCHASGDVVGSVYVGGLIGRAQDHCSIQNSYSTGSVIEKEEKPANGTYPYSYYPIGGLIGSTSDYSGVSNSYTTGLVIPLDGNISVGGLVGITENTINNTSLYSETTGLNTGCYSKTSSVQTSCNKLTSKTVAEMQTPQTFIDAGWDTTIWELVQGQYPKLIGVGGQ